MKLLLAVCAVFLALCAPAAAAFPHPPKWLKPPYRKYVITLAGADTSHATVDTAFTSDMDGAGPCDEQTRHYDGTGKANPVVSYNVLFGRAKSHRKFHTALIWLRAQETGGIQSTISVHTNTPPGCAPSDPSLADETCTEQDPVYVGSPSELGFYIVAKRKSHGVQKFTAAMNLDYTDSGEGGTCTGGDPTLTGISFPGDAPTHYAVFAPTQANLSFTDRGVRARKTFTGTLRHTFPHGDGSEPGQGVDPQSDGPQRTWSFTVSEAGTFTLAPLR